MQESAGGRANPTSKVDYSSSYIKTFGRYVGEKVQVHTGRFERPTVGIVTDADELGIVIETAATERLIPWTAITSVRRARA